MRTKQEEETTMPKGMILFNIDAVLYTIATLIAGKNRTLQFFAVVGGAIALVINLIRGKYFQK